MIILRKNFKYEVFFIKWLKIIRNELDSVYFILYLFLLFLFYFRIKG